MIIEFVGNKAQMASAKHFNGAFSEAQMKQLAAKVIKNATRISILDYLSCQLLHLCSTECTIEVLLRCHLCFVTYELYNHCLILSLCMDLSLIHI